MKRGNERVRYYAMQVIELQKKNKALKAREEELVEILKRIIERIETHTRDTDPCDFSHIPLEQARAAIRKAQAGKRIIFMSDEIEGIYDK